MRYKDLVLTKLEAITDKLNVVQSLLSQGAPRNVVESWFQAIKDQTEEIATLLNTERQD